MRREMADQTRVALSTNLAQDADMIQLCIIIVCLSLIIFEFIWVNCKLSDEVVRLTKDIDELERKNNLLKAAYFGDSTSRKKNIPPFDK